MTTPPDLDSTTGPAPASASSGGTRSRAGSNYGDWCPQRVRDQPDGTVDEAAAAPGAVPPPGGPRPEAGALPTDLPSAAPAP